MARPVRSVPTPPLTRAALAAVLVAVAAAPGVAAARPAPPVPVAEGSRPPQSATPAVRSWDPGARPEVRTSAVYAPPAATAQVDGQTTGPGDHGFTVPEGATSLSVVLTGPAALGGLRKGTTVTATAQVTPGGQIRPGRQLVVHIDGANAELRAADSSGVLLRAPGGLGGFPVIEETVFPVSSVQPDTGSGTGSGTWSITVPAAEIASIPTTVDFGRAAAAAPVAKSITLNVGGGAPLILASATADGPFSVDAGGSTCAPGTGRQTAGGGSCTVSVVFTPQTPAAATGKLTLTGNFTGSPRTVVLSGTATALPAAPGQLSAAPGEGTVGLSWMPPADDGGTPVTGYQIHRWPGGEETPPPADPPVIGSIGPGVLTFTDTAPPAGPNSYAVRAVNAVGPSPLSAPATAGTMGTITVEENSLPAGVVGVPYQGALRVNGGTAPYHWTLDGTLPAGLSLDPATGYVTGTPVAAGDTTFAVAATDSSAPPRGAQGRMTVSIAPAPAPAPSAAVPLPAVPARASTTGGTGGPGTWLWGLLGAAGLVGVFVAVRRLRRGQ